jgi:hypothetical protein
MHGGKIVDAVIKAVLDTTDGLKYQVDSTSGECNQRGAPFNRSGNWKDADPDIPILIASKAEFANPGQTLLLNEVNLKEEKCTVVREVSTYLDRIDIVVKFSATRTRFWGNDSPLNTLVPVGSAREKLNSSTL